MKAEQMEAIHQYVKNIFSSDTTGHDFYHMRRVAQLAKEIAKVEHANCFICEVGGWLHDIGDPKLFAHPHQAIEQMNELLRSIHLTKQEINEIHEAIDSVSFSKGKVPKTLEGKIVQDADRLDAIGAIGIARTFAYGGASDQQIFHEQQDNTSVHHFYDKLLTLKDQMNTEFAKEVAIERHQFMEQFLNQFYKEW